MSGLNPSFFKKEIRSDFLVDEKRKKVWAVELEMLEKLDEVCKNHDITYWVPDEYGRVLIDPKHPWQASLESEDASDIRLPSSCLSGLPAVGNSRTERRHAEQEKERKLQEERLRLFREERERTARQEVLLHRLTQSILTARG